MEIGIRCGFHSSNWPMIMIVSIDHLLKTLIISPFLGEFVGESLYRTEWLHKRHHTARVSVLSTAFEATRRFLENGKWFG